MANLNADDVFGADPAVERLIADLDSRFPHYLPSPDDSNSLIMYRAGQRAVVEYLLTLIEN